MCWRWCRSHQFLFAIGSALRGCASSGRVQPPRDVRRQPPGRGAAPPLVRPAVSLLRNVVKGRVAAQEAGEAGSRLGWVGSQQERGVARPRATCRRPGLCLRRLHHAVLPPATDRSHLADCLQLVRARARGRDKRRDIYIRYGSIKYREVYRSVILMVAGSSSSVDPPQVD